MTFQGLFKIDFNDNVVSLVNKDIGANCLSFEIYNDTSLLVPITYGGLHVYKEFSGKHWKAFKTNNLSGLLIFLSIFLNHEI